MILSIITPYYNVLRCVKELAQILEPQLKEEVEWIVIDDGCNEKELDNLKAKVIHLEENSGGASVPRNVGLDIAKGKYICFLDADDKISDDYIETILNKIQNEDFDYCYFGWKSTHFTVLIEDEPPDWNCCVWNCIYKKELIGENRFNPEFKMAEDFNFNQKVRKGKKAIIPKILYYYNDLQPNSLTKQSTLFNEKYYRGDKNV